VSNGHPHRTDPQGTFAPRERELARQLARLEADAQAVLGTRFGTGEAEDRGLESSGETLAAIALLTLESLRSLETGDPRVAELCDLAVRAADLEVDLRDSAVQRRKRALAGVEAGLGRLRCMSTSAELVDNVCQQIVGSCGFTRAMLSRVDGNTWMPWITHFGHREVRPSDAEWMANTRIPLRSMTLERELLETQHAAYVVNASEDPRADTPFVAATRATSYVAAPVIPAGRVIGFLHADYYPSDRTVDRVDRDILWAFAEGFGRIYERTVLLERLNAQRDHVRDTLRTAETIMDKLARGELELARHEDERSMVSSATTLALAGERSSMDELLTPREREVLSLIVVGQSNSAIAARLVISEGTVKSHVKQILRKIGAVNRSEAIARYLGMVGTN
jgi:DNA-binding CsgD family transcriptional regulator